MKYLLSCLLCLSTRSQGGMGDANKSDQMFHQIVVPVCVFLCLASCKMELEVFSGLFLLHV